jgi:hypothetical protein
VSTDPGAESLNLDRPARAHQTVHSGTCPGRDWHNGRLRQEASGDEAAGFLRNGRHAGRVHQVGLGNDDQAGGDSQQPHDMEVLDGLWHDAIIGRDHEQHEIYARGTGQHVVEEAFVAGNIHDADAATVRQGERSKPQVDGHTARPFLRQGIWVMPGQELDERRLAMVNMTGRPDRERQDRPGMHALTHAGRPFRRRAVSRSPENQPAARRPYSRPAGLHSSKRSCGPA